MDPNHEGLLANDSDPISYRRIPRGFWHLTMNTVIAAIIVLPAAFIL